MPGRTEIENSEPPPVRANADHRQGRALAVLIAGAMAIALSPILVRLSDVGPTTAAFWRVTLAVPALLVLMPLQAGDSAAKVARKAKRGPHAFRLIALSGVLFAGDLFCWHLSIAWTTVANATLLANFTPIIVTLFAWLLFAQRPTGRFMACLAVALLGAILLTGGNPLGSAEALKGDAMGLLTACFYGAYILTISRLRAYCTTGEIMAYSAIVTATLLLPVALFMDASLFPAGLYGWGVLLALALISHAAGQGMIAYALAHLTAAFSSLALLVQPVAAAILAWVLFSEAIGPVQAIGGAIILAAVATARSAAVQEKPAVKS